MIQLSNIYKHYAIAAQRQTILRGIDLQVEPGELVALMGASGSGKTTAMNIIGLLDRPCSGEYRLSGKNVSALTDTQAAQLRNQTFGFIFQNFFLLPRLTAWENVALPLNYRRLTPAVRKEMALNSLAQVGLAALAQQHPNQLSGGQQQRVAIARALIGQPQILLADEPTGALDSKTGQTIMDLLLAINHQQRMTIILVTHDPHIASQCQRIIQLADGRLCN